MIDQDFASEFKKKTLNVLKYAISFFEEHDIKYFMAYGTAIGCVRHKGYIPWDDDIDICMPREDYNKLISIRHKMNEDKYRFFYIADKDYHLPFGKIIDVTTTLIESNRFPFVSGCYIDIFPMDLTNIGAVSFAAKWTQYYSKKMKYQALISKINIRETFYNCSKGHYGALLLSFLKFVFLFADKNKALRNLLSYEDSLNSKNGDRYVSYTEGGMYMFAKYWFDSYILMPFEDTMVRMPVGYHEYLTYYFGDYMTPPPEKEQIPNFSHGKVYCNLTERLTLKTVKQRIKKGEHLVY